MPKIRYRDGRLNGKAMKTVQLALAIIEDLHSQGYTLTLRQLYYQMVAANMIANNEREYKRLGRIISDARELGMIDWYHIEDRGRSCYMPGHTPTPEEVLEGIENQLRLNPWLDQDVYLVVGVEKAALEGVIERPASRWRAPYMSCRGYLSSSEAWRSGRRFERARADGKRCVFLHLGDHDPSGLHMTVDNATRLNMFAWGGVEVNRLALHMEQVEEHSLPENPAKQTDTRFEGYKAQYETESSWELDALSPKIIDGLIHEAIKSYVDKDKWEATLALEAERRQGLRLLGMRWSEVQALVLGDELNPLERTAMLDAILEELPSLMVQSGSRLMAQGLATGAALRKQIASEIDAVEPSPPTAKSKDAGWHAGYDVARGHARQVAEESRDIPPFEEDVALRDELEGAVDTIQVVQDGRQTFDKPEPIKPERSPFEGPSEDEGGDEEHDPELHPDGYDPDEPLPPGFEEA